jgi:hypothetical protein
VTYRYSGRTYDVTKKLSKLTDYAFMGSSGSISFSKKVMDKVKNNINADTPVEKMAYIIRDISAKTKEEVINNDAFVYLKVDPEEYKKKDPNINPEMMRNLQRRIDNLLDGISTDFMIVGYEPSSGIGMYDTSNGQEPVPLLNYYTTGSGSDLADATIAKWVQGMKPDERERISMSKGCRILMEATRSSWHNAGVGGRTQLVWTGKGSPFKELGYDESNMLQNVLYLEEVHALDRDFVDAVFTDVVESGATYKDIRKNLSKKLSKRNLVDIFFKEGLHT